MKGSGEGLGGRIWRDKRMDGCNRESLCRGIPLKKAALQEHVQTEWSEAQGDVGLHHTHTQKHTL